MHFTFQCSACEGELEADSSLSGGVSECPHCGTSVAVPYSQIGAGTTIAGFRFERLLGKGGMGEVYLATQLSMDRHVAVKILPRALAENKEAVARFLHEVRTSAKLNHPNIVSAIEAGDDDGVFFLAMGYVDGASLDVRLKKGETVPEKEAFDIVGTVAEALAYAWDEFQILHRDIKPANIMVDRRGRIQLMDLGLAKSLGEESGMTVTGAVLGTPHYMSPEQVRGMADLDVRSDVYSLGATLYHLATGAPPFSGDSALGIMAKHVNEPLPPPKERNPEISGACAQLIGTMMAKDRDDRPATWQEVVRLVDDARAGKSAGHGGAQAALAKRAQEALHHRQQGSAKAKVSSKETPASHPKKPLGKLIIAAVAVGVVLLGVVGIVVASRGKSTDAKAVVATTNGTDQVDRTDRTDQTDQPRTPATGTAPATAPVTTVMAETKDKELAAPATRRAESAKRLEDESRKQRAEAQAADAKKEAAAEAAKTEAAAVAAAKQKADDDEAKAAAVSKAVANPLLDILDPIAAQLLAGRATTAAKSWREARNAPELKPFAKDLATVDSQLAAATSLDAVILASFRKDIGKSETIFLRKGKVQGKILEVSSQGIKMAVLLPGGKGTMGRTVKLQELSIREELRRLGKGDTPEQNLMRGLLAVEADRLDVARKLFDKAGGPLAAALATALAELENKEAETAADLAARKLLRTIARSTSSQKRDDIIREVRVKCSKSPANIQQAKKLLGKYEKEYGETETGKKWIALVRAAIPVPKPGKNWTVPNLDMGFVPVASGSFKMGANEMSVSLRPVHAVRISRNFWIGKYEVTQAEYKQLTGKNPSEFKAPGNPVESVSWYNAMAFCAKLTDRERHAVRLPAGYEYRLPTEAEWEYAARGGANNQDYTYSGSYAPEEVAWFDANSEKKTHPVGGKRANKFGVYDMSGNVWEWCLGWYDEVYYGKSPREDPRGPSSGSRRVFRGGSWGYSGSHCRVAVRNCRTPSDVLNNVGFRVVLAPRLAQGQDEQ